MSKTVIEDPVEAYRLLLAGGMVLQPRDSTPVIVPAGRPITQEVFVVLRDQQAWRYPRCRAEHALPGCIAPVPHPNLPRGVQAWRWAQDRSDHIH